MNLCEILGVDADHLVQKVKPFNASKIKYPCIVNEKYDGVYCIAYCDGVDVNIFSRTGEEYLSLNHLKAELYDYLGEETGFAIFEAYCDGVPQSTISGWCRDEQNQHNEIIAIVHDNLTMKEYLGEDKTPYWKREITCDMSVYKYLRHPYRVVVSNQEQLERIVQEVWDRGGEGIVIKNPDAPYSKGKRNWDLMKLKRSVSYDLRVLALEEGQGKYKGMLGKLICQWKDGKSIKVGSGLTDEQRKAWWDTSYYTEFYKEIVGKVVQIDAMAESSKGVLREPVFRGIRYDKKKADFE